MPSKAAFPGVIAFDSFTCRGSKRRSVCGAHSAAVWQSLTQFSTQAVLMDRITAAAAAPHHECGRRLLAWWRHRRQAARCILLPSPASCLPPSLPPPLLAFQSSKSDEGRVRLRLLFSVRGGSSPASLVVPFGPPATAAAVPPKEISAAGVGWEMGSHDRAAVAFSPSTRLSSLRSVLGGHHSSVLTQDGRSVCWRVRRPSVTASRVPNPLGGAFLIVLYRGRMDRSSDQGSDSVRPSLLFPAAATPPRPATLPPSPLHHNP